jgi:hypothetical protein
MYMWHKPFAEVVGLINITKTWYLSSVYFSDDDPYSSPVRSEQALVAEFAEHLLNKVSKQPIWKDIN